MSGFVTDAEYGSYLWISGNGKLLTNWSASQNPSIYVELITSSNLAIHTPWPGGYNQSTNVTVTIFSISGNAPQSFSTNLTGQGDDWYHDYPYNHPPGYPFLVIRGSILHCYAIEGPELAGSISLSDAAITTNGGFSFHATALTESASRLQASPDAKTWTDVGRYTRTLILSSPPRQRINQQFYLEAPGGEKRAAHV